MCSANELYSDWRQVRGTRKDESIIVLAFYMYNKLASRKYSWYSLFSYTTHNTHCLLNKEFLTKGTTTSVHQSIHFNSLDFDSSTSICISHPFKCSDILDPSFRSVLWCLFPQSKKSQNYDESYSCQIWHHASQVRMITNCRAVDSNHIKSNTCYIGQIIINIEIGKF
jgi:hypothetical protein